MDDNKPLRDAPEDQPHDSGAEGGAAGRRTFHPPFRPMTNRRWATPTSIPTPTRERALKAPQSYRNSQSSTVRGPSRG
jgi:hypothetical protein